MQRMKGVLVLFTLYSTLVYSFLFRTLLTGALTSSSSYGPSLRSLVRLDSASAAQMDEIEINNVYSDLEVPDNTENEYSQFKMKNGIEVTCVRIANSEKSAATMAVKVGAAMDETLGVWRTLQSMPCRLLPWKWKCGIGDSPREDKCKAHLSK